MAQQLDVGAVGWRHAGWHDRFYPESLPSEWQLTYYSNEYARVLVPTGDWHGAGGDVIAGWRDDVHDRFGFYLDMPADADADMRASLAQAVEVLGPRLSGVVLRVGEDSPVAVLDGLRQLLGPTPMLFVDVPAPSLRLWLDAARGAQASLCWRPEHGQQLRGCGLGLLRATEAAGNRRVLRSHIENFLRQAENVDELTLLFEGAPPPVTAMQDAQIITSLLAGE
jgi:hypothetical protein